MFYFSFIPSLVPLSSRIPYPSTSEFKIHVLLCTGIVESQSLEPLFVPPNHPSSRLPGLPSSSPPIYSTHDRHGSYNYISHFLKPPEGTGASHLVTIHLPRFSILLPRVFLHPSSFFPLPSPITLLPSSSFLLSGSFLPLLMAHLLSFLYVTSYTTVFQPSVGIRKLTNSKNRFSQCTIHLIFPDKAQTPNLTLPHPFSRIVSPACLLSMEDSDRGLKIWRAPNNQCSSESIRVNLNL